MRADPTTPCGWANMLVTMWGDRYPVDVRQIAREYSTRFADPILAVKEADVARFEGALYPVPGRSGWAILYNPTVSSKGRINYTLGHELGHYLCHRAGSKEGFECGVGDVLGATQIQERQADQFASYLLMPLTDFRAQIDREHMTLDLLRHCADRYGVSLTAAALKWLESTSQCASVVVAENGFILWSRQSAAARRARIFFPSGMELPAGSVAARGDQVGAACGTDLAPGIWGDLAVREIAIFADQYEMTISLLVFEESGILPDGWEDEPVEDSYDRFTR